MHARIISFILAIFLSGQSTLAMTPQEELIPVVLSSKPAPWTKLNAPQVFDVNLTTTAKRNNIETVVKRGGQELRFIGSKGNGSALSPDGLLLANPERAFKIDMISIWNLALSEETIIPSNGSLSHIALSGKSSSLMAFVESARPSLIKISNYTRGLTLGSLDMGKENIEKIALNIDGSLLAIVISADSNSHKPMNLVVVVSPKNNFRQLAAIQARDKKIVNVAFGEHLVLEFEQENGERLIKTIALFDSATVNEQQNTLLNYLHKAFDSFRGEQEKPVINLNDLQQEAFDSLPIQQQNMLNDVAVFTSTGAM